MATVLIVDDELDMRVLVRLVLEAAGEGFTVLGEATDGLAGLEEWRRLNDPPDPDIVVLDNRMPGLTGVDVARQIHEQSPGQLVVLFTAYPGPEIQQQAEAAGVHAVVSKTELEKLPALLMELLRDRTSAAD